MPMSKTGPLLLLDTHVWVWLMEGASALRPEVREKIQRAAQFGQLRVSIISIWEVAMLEAKGRLTFAVDCHRWIADALAAPGISLIQLTPEMAVDSTRLPGPFHGDPADRMLVATARSGGAVLVTADKSIHAYARQGFLNCIST